MEKTIYLHIGTFKTGSTSVQEFICQHAGDLEKEGYFIPKGQLIGHHELPLSLILNYSNFRAPWASFRGGVEENWRTIFQQISETTCNNIIISSENFCDIVNEHCIDQSEEMGRVIKSYMKDYNVKVVVYLRPIPNYIKSTYRQIIKISTETSSLAVMANRFMRQHSMHMYPSVYLDYYAKLFGRESIIARIYTKENLFMEDVVKDFMLTVGLSREVVKGIPPIQKNRSFSERDTMLKRVFNLSGNKGLDFNMEISNCLINLDDILSTPGNVGIDEQVLLAEIHKEHELIRDKYGVSLEVGESVRFSEDEVDDQEKDQYLLIVLLAISLRQNRNILNKLSELDNKVNQLVSTKT